MTAKQFRQWMQAGRYTVAAAALELGISPRIVAYYRAGTQPIPRLVELACEALSNRKDRTHETHSR